MSKGVKKVLGIVAAIAIPFVAPMIAGALGTAMAGAGWASTGAFLGTAGGSALTGAVLGGAASGLTGGNPLTGALMGGLGGFAGAGGFQGMFGGPAAASTNAVSGPMTASLRPPVGAAGAAGTAGVTGAAAGGAAGAAGAAGATTAGGLGDFFQKVGQGILANPAGVAQLAMTVFGRPPQELTAVEQAQLEELKGMATTNREMFEQRVRGANEMIQMAAQQAPNPQQAFAETKIASERQLGEQTRGMGADEAAFAQRRAGIRSTQAGATAAAAEEARGRQTQAGLMQTGYGMLPDQAPQGVAGLSMPIYQSLQDRRDQYTRDLASGAGDLFGGIA